ncbi:MAG: ABC transporter permease [Dehalococcoidia bacterium]|nr:ABC transporter permease [Dehalococcoidia bacterium]
MTRYVVQRLFMVIPVLLGVTLVTFFAMRVIPGDLAQATLGENATPEAVAAFREEHGLDDPLVVQYLRWVGGLARFDLGDSFRGADQPVLDEVLRRLPVTFELALFALFFSLIISFPAGIISAVKQDSLADYSARIISMFGLAVPSFVMGSLMFTLPAIWWGWIPPIRYTGFTDNPIDNMALFVLPGLALGAGLAGSVTRMIRSQLLEVLRQDYIRTARAKGVAGHLVVYRHAMRNALIPVLTVIGLQVGVLLGGTIIIESIFTLPGLGRLMIESVSLRDYPMVQGIVVFLAFAYVVVNLLVDLTYAWLDPRIRYS